MERKRAWLKRGALIVVPCALLLALGAVAQRNRQRGYVQEWIHEIDKGVIDNKPDVAHVQYLLDQGVDANTRNWRDLTMLHRMAQVGNVEGTNLLLAHGANPNARESGGGCTPLMYECSEPFFNAEVFHALLKHGADINAHDNAGNTALFWSHKSTPLMKTLLESGADANAHNQDGQSALYKVIHPPVFLHNNYESTLPWCDIEKAQLLLAHGANPNLQDDAGNTILMLLAIETDEGYSNLTDCARLLLKHGARLDLRNNQGLTALQLAHKSGARSLARLLERAALKS